MRLVSGDTRSLGRLASSLLRLPQIGPLCDRLPRAWGGSGIVIAIETIAVPTFPGMYRHFGLVMTLLLGRWRIASHGAI
jgi:hypothetical protein